MKKHYLADALLLFTTIIWGTSFPLTKAILNSGTSPITLMMIRALISSVLVIPFLIHRRKIIKWSIYDLKAGIILGIYGFFGFVFQTVGAVYTTPGKNAFLTVIYVVFVPIILFIFYKQKISAYNIIAVVTALIGAYVLAQLFPGFTIENKKEFLGDSLTFISAIFWAFQIIQTGRCANKSDMWVLLFYQFAIYFILSLPTVFLFKQNTTATAVSLVEIAYLAVFCSVLSFAIMFYGLKYTSPERAAIIFTFEGVFGALFSIIVGLEPFAWITIIGSAIIFLSLLISQYTT